MKGREKKKKDTKENRKCWNQAEHNYNKKPVAEPWNANGLSFNHIYLCADR